MGPGRLRSKHFRRRCRPALKIRCRDKPPAPRFDARAYMEYQNFVVSQDRMCATIQVSFGMFVLWLVACIIHIATEPIKMLTGR